jgi:hypothetical protein
MTITLSTNDLTADRDALLALLGGTPAAPGGTVAPPPPAESTDFPADSANATVPSPENSRIEVANGVLSGRPYLVDANAMTHRLDVAGKYTVNGIAAQFADPAATVTTLLVRQGMVFATISSGQIQQANPGMGMGMYNVALPSAWAPGTNAPPPPVLAEMPSPSITAPGSSGVVIRCGNGEVIPTISAGILLAMNGDTVQITRGNYHEALPAITKAIILDGGGSTLDATGLTAQLAGGGKGLIVPQVDCIIRNFAMISGVAMDQPAGQLTSAIRPDFGCGYLTVEGVILQANQCGIGHGGSPCVISVTDSDISNNGLKANPGSLTHNMYVGAECRRLTLTNVTSLNPNEAHAVKYRGPELIVSGGTYEAPHGSCFNLPDGSGVKAKLTNVRLMKIATADDHKVLSYCDEAQSMGVAGMLITGGSADLRCANPLAAGQAGTLSFVGTTFSGNKLTASGGVIVTGVS